MATRKLCITKQHIPKESHFAILEFITIAVPGDERSRSHPGHGYPASTEEVVLYYSYTDRAEWEAETGRNMVSSKPDKYLSIVVTIPKVEVVTKVTIDV